MFGFAYRATCPDCGAAFDAGALEEHVCDDDHRVTHQIATLRPRIEAFEGEFAAWLETPAGQFARWDATRSGAA